MLPASIISNTTTATTKYLLKSSVVTPLLSAVRTHYKNSSIQATQGEFRYMSTQPLPHLHRPSMVTIDAYDTMYTPSPSISEQYAQVFHKHGYPMDHSVISNIYLTKFKKIYAQYPNYGKNFGLTVYQFWDMFLRELFMGLVTITDLKTQDKEPTTTLEGSSCHHPSASKPFETFSDIAENDGHIAVCEMSQTQFDSIMNDIILKLSKREAYMIHDDVFPFLHKLKDQKIPNYIASNADKNVTTLIIDEFGLPFDSKHIYLSYDLDVVKPNVRFFQKIVSDHCESNDLNYADVLVDAWHVGDEVHKDSTGALESGMNTVLIDRDNKYEYFDESIKERENDWYYKVHDKFYVIKDLRDFSKLFD